MKITGLVTYRKSGAVSIEIDQRGKRARIQHIPRAPRADNCLLKNVNRISNHQQIIPCKAHFSRDDHSGSGFHLPPSAQQISQWKSPVMPIPPRSPANSPKNPSPMSNCLVCLFVRMPYLGETFRRQAGYGNSSEALSKRKQRNKNVSTARLTYDSIYLHFSVGKCTFKWNGRSQNCISTPARIISASVTIELDLRVINQHTNWTVAKLMAMIASDWVLILSFPL